MITVLKELLFRDETFWIALALWAIGVFVGDVFFVGSRSIGELLTGVGLLLITLRLLIGSGVILHRSYRAGKTGYEESLE
ncbi:MULTISPECIES: hypothetical protein [unclassified Haladaptatus]|uniref:hypothetical protein n=1 Tax=unclassified Haladaptatus TaxID=2622732 RepID=UPI002FCDEC03